jgi:hypothetical protein
VELALIFALALAVAYFGYLAMGLLRSSAIDETFDGGRARAAVERQVAFGTRTTGTPSSLQTSDWMVDQLTSLGWDVLIQTFPISADVEARNIVAIRTPDSPPAGVAMLATHYDSRLAADLDPNPENRSQPAPGANFGASGAAVLLELARTLDVDRGGHTVCLAFLDAEANEGIPGWGARTGSRQLAPTLTRDVPRCASPRLVVGLDMVGASDARFQPDLSAAQWINLGIWRTAAELGHSATFPTTIAESPWSGSQTAFADEGFATGAIVDRDFPNARTLSDTPAFISAATLEAVGRTLEEWLERGAPAPPGSVAPQATPVTP